MRRSVVGVDKQMSEDERLSLNVSELSLSVRTVNCLEERGVLTVRDLLMRTADELKTFSNFGEKTLTEVYKALDRIGFRRKRVEEPELCPLDL